MLLTRLLYLKKNFFVALCLMKSYILRNVRKSRNSAWSFRYNMNLCVYTLYIYSYIMRCNISLILFKCTETSKMSLWYTCNLEERTFLYVVDTRSECMVTCFAVNPEAVSCVCCIQRGIHHHIWRRKCPVALYNRPIAPTILNPITAKGMYL